MDFTIHITVHVYAEERLCDECLEIGSECYGIPGKEVIAPLREVNGKNYRIENVSEQFTVQDLWDWIGNRLYAAQPAPTPEFQDYLSYVRRYGVVKAYLCFNGIRYSVEKTGRPLIDFLRLKSAGENELVEVQLLVSANAGDVCRDDGIRYYINSKEQGRHNEPHVHIAIHNEMTGTFSLITGEQLQKKCTVKEKYAKKIREKILSNQKEWLIYWNDHTDGLNVDLNQVLGLIRY